MKANELMINGGIAMNYEEKYKEALGKAKTMLSTATVFDYDDEQIAHDIRTTVYEICPELKESEDEKIRKEIIQHFQNILKGGADTTTMEDTKRWLAYLEKQKEQKLDDVKREWWNKGYLEGRKNAHIPARELGLPSSCDFQKEQKPADGKEYSSPECGTTAGVWSEEEEDAMAELNEKIELYAKHREANGGPIKDVDKYLRELRGYEEEEE